MLCEWGDGSVVCVAGQARTHLRRVLCLVLGALGKHGQRRAQQQREGGEDGRRLRACRGVKRAGLQTLSGAEGKQRGRAAPSAPRGKAWVAAAPPAARPPRRAACRLRSGPPRGTATRGSARWTRRGAPRRAVARRGRPAATPARVPGGPARVAGRQQGCGCINAGAPCGWLARPGLACWSWAEVERAESGGWGAAARGAGAGANGRRTEGQRKRRNEGVPLPRTRTAAWSL